MLDSEDLVKINNHFDHPYTLYIPLMAINMDCSIP